MLIPTGVGNRCRNHHVSYSSNSKAVLVSMVHRRHVDDDDGGDGDGVISTIVFPYVRPRC